MRNPDDKGDGVIGGIVFALVSAIGNVVPSSTVGRVVDNGFGNHE